MCSEGRGSRTGPSFSLEPRSPEDPPGEGSGSPWLFLHRGQLMSADSERGGAGREGDDPAPVVPASRGSLHLLYSQSSLDISSLWV